MDSSSLPEWSTRSQTLTVERHKACRGFQNSEDLVGVLLRSQTAQWEILTTDLGSKVTTWVVDVSGMSNAYCVELELLVDRHCIAVATCILTFTVLCSMLAGFGSNLSHIS